MTSAITHHSLLVVLLMVFVAELGLPTGISPKVALLILGGTAIGSLPMLAIALALVASANLLGACTLHAVARRGGGWLNTRFMRRFGGNPERVMARWRARLGGHDAAAIFVGRVTPVVRIYVTVATGITGVQWRDFLLGAGPAALVWSGGPLALGYAFRGEAARVAASPMVVEAVALAVPLIGGLVAGVGWVVHATSQAEAFRRLRVVVAAGGSLATIAWAVKVVRANAWAHERGASALDVPVLAWWLLVLGVMVAVAVVTASRDIRLASSRPSPMAPARWPASVLAWSGAVSTAVVVMVAIERMYPAL